MFEVTSNIFKYLMINIITLSMIRCDLCDTIEAKVKKPCPKIQCQPNKSLSALELKGQFICLQFYNYAVFNSSCYKIKM